MIYFLWEILKNELEVGPIYHYVERRIRGHIFVCFIALQMKVLLSKKIKEIDEEARYSEVMRDISKVKAVEINIEDEGKVIVRTNLKGKAKIGYKALGLKIPPRIFGTVK